MERGRPAIDHDAAGIGPVETGENPHQGRFPGPVFSQETMDFAVFQDKIRPIVRLNIGKSFDNPSHGDSRRGG